jgi:hypothetical protein
LPMRIVKRSGNSSIAASRWMMIIRYARVSTTEQNLGLEHDDLKPAFDALVRSERIEGRTP